MLDIFGPSGPTHEQFERLQAMLLAALDQLEKRGLLDIEAWHASIPKMQAEMDQWKAELREQWKKDNPKDAKWLSLLEAANMPKELKAEA